MLPIVALALASFTASNALVIPRTSNVPSTYAQGFLEPYDVYHTRYLALDCEAQHSTPFFDACCHPLLATENLKDNRAAECSPSAATPTNSGDDCDDGESTPAVTAPTQTPNNVAPEPSTPASSTTPAPRPSSSPAPKPSSSPAAKSSTPSPQPSSPASSGGILGDLISGGIATFFFQNGVAGACGTVHQDSDFVVALPTAAYENGKNCGRKIEIIDPASGNKQTATVADECPTCENDSCLDLSHALFNAFAGDGQGEFNVQYRYID